MPATEKMNNEHCFPNKSKGIIIAADVSTLSELQHLVQLSTNVPEVVGIKIGFSLSLRYGLAAVVDTVNKIHKIPIIYDHQKAATDIPTMGKPFADICCEAGIKGVILFPQAGPKTLEAFVIAVLENNMTPIVGLVMTHSAYLQTEGGFISDSAPEKICGLAMLLGVRSFVLPGNKYEIVSKFSQGSLLPVSPVEIMMPGIGTQGGSIMEAFNASKGHHPFAIVGSAIYKSNKPQVTLMNLAKEIRI
ncbi:MAG: orotidine 5'-phosphate decarboxylase [Proteobacteria bacterium]|nr:orotidine 5'-phosphate decarboxylase [Pseudomonadota bacterium]